MKKLRRRDGSCPSIGKNQVDSTDHHGMMPPGPSSFNHASFTSDPSLSIHHLPTTFNPIFTILLTENSLTPTSFPVLCCRSLLSVSPHATIGIVVPPTFDLISLQKRMTSLLSPQTPIEYIYATFRTNSPTYSQLKLEIASFADRFDPIIIMNTDMIFLKDIIPSVSTFFESQKLIALTHQPISPSSLYHSITHHPDESRKSTSYLLIRSSFISLLFSTWAKIWDAKKQDPFLLNPSDPSEVLFIPQDLIEQTSFSIALNKALSLISPAQNSQAQAISQIQRSSLLVDKNLVARQTLLDQVISENQSFSDPGMYLTNEGQYESPNINTTIPSPAMLNTKSTSLTHINTENPCLTPDFSKEDQSHIVSPFPNSQKHIQSTLLSEQYGSDSPKLELLEYHTSPADAIATTIDSRPQSVNSASNLSPFLHLYPIVPVNTDLEQHGTSERTHSVLYTAESNRHQDYEQNRTDLPKPPFSETKNRGTLENLVDSPSPQDRKSPLFPPLVQAEGSRNILKRSYSFTQMEGQKNSHPTHRSPTMTDGFIPPKAESYKIELPMMHRSEPPKPKEDTDLLLSSLSIQSSQTPRIGPIRPKSVVLLPSREKNVDRETSPHLLLDGGQTNSPLFRDINGSPYLRPFTRTSSRILPLVDTPTLMMSPTFRPSHSHSGSEQSGTTHTSRPNSLTDIFEDDSVKLPISAPTIGIAKKNGVWRADTRGNHVSASGDTSSDFLQSLHTLHHRPSSLLNSIVVPLDHADRVISIQTHPSPNPVRQERPQHSKPSKNQNPEAHTKPTEEFEFPHPRPFESTIQVVSLSRPSAIHATSISPLVQGQPIPQFCPCCGKSLAKPEVVAGSISNDSSSEHFDWGSRGGQVDGLSQTPTCSKVTPEQPSTDSYAEMDSYQKLRLRFRRNRAEGEEHQGKVLNTGNTPRTNYTFEDAAVLSRFYQPPDSTPQSAAASPNTSHREVHFRQSETAVLRAQCAISPNNNFENQWTQMSSGVGDLILSHATVKNAKVRDVSNFGSPSSPFELVNSMDTSQNSRAQVKSRLTDSTQSSQLNSARPLAVTESLPVPSQSSRHPFNIDLRNQPLITAQPNPFQPFIPSQRRTRSEIVLDPPEVAAQRRTMSDPQVDSPRMNQTEVGEDILFDYTKYSQHGIRTLRFNDLVNPVQDQGGTSSPSEADYDQDYTEHEEEIEKRYNSKIDLVTGVRTYHSPEGTHNISNTHQPTKRTQLLKQKESRPSRKSNDVSVSIVVHVIQPRINQEELLIEERKGRD
ncbi:hypothetical protein BLNAU_9803 [Blattamonas nauphoetae]|uniref:Uncharacterized protein n=1 Tax=Blattamonas nauphoetae TaxID=2049346 RepID=A0ABQ9XUV2_9EUKA|nr:hypothetical protein BLNAU_9803 [Blattamonas nauphoetae]